MKESPVENYFLTDIKIEAKTTGEISFAKGWKFKNVSIKATSPGEIKIQNSSDMDTGLSPQNN